MGVLRQTRGGTPIPDIALDYLEWAALDEAAERHEQAKKSKWIAENILAGKFYFPFWEDHALW